MTANIHIRGNTIPVEARLAVRDTGRIGENVAELIKAAAFMIAVGGRGDATVMNTLLEGASNLMFEEAGNYAKMGHLIALMDRKKS